MERRKKTRLSGFVTINVSAITTVGMMTPVLASVAFPLAGTACLWFNNVEPDLCTWSDFVTAFKEAFDLSNELMFRALQELNCRCQHPDETCEAYVQDVLWLCRLIKPSMTEMDKVDHVLKGISDVFFNALVSRDVKTVSECFVVCRRR